MICSTTATYRLNSFKFGQWVFLISREVTSGCLSLTLCLNHSGLEVAEHQLHPQKLLSDHLPWRRREGFWQTASWHLSLQDKGKFSMTDVDFVPYLDMVRIQVFVPLQFSKISLTYTIFFKQNHEHHTPAPKTWHHIHFSFLHYTHEQSEAVWWASQRNPWVWYGSTFLALLGTVFGSGHVQLHLLTQDLFAIELQSLLHVCLWGKVYVAKFPVNTSHKTKFRCHIKKGKTATSCVRLSFNHVLSCIKNLPGWKIKILKWV